MNYKKHYYSLIEKYGALIKPTEGYTERHHIQPKCLDGNDSDENQVYLSGRAHFIAHRLLNKIYPDNSKLLTAVVLMSAGQKNSAKKYELLKNEYAKQRNSEGKIQGKPVVTPKGTFASIWEAAKAHGLSRSRMAKKLRSLSFTCRFYYFLGEEKKTKTRTGHGLHLAKQVKTPLGLFASCREAAIAHKVCHSVIARRAKNPKREDYQYV